MKLWFRYSFGSRSFFLFSFPKIPKIINFITVITLFGYRHTHVLLRGIKLSLGGGTSVSTLHVKICFDPCSAIVWYLNTGLVVANMLGSRWRF